MSTSRTPRSSRAGCPVCGSPAVPAHAPFCSRGCRDRDLLAWFGEGYRIPARPTEAEAAEIDSSPLDSDADPRL
ncbi:DNA gyrase inhibitor YacG [Sphingomonas sp. 1P06PA]|uniref:DNA gyrase inhibitor YacG n=1 Tax=Sphingomonas sp. 1P06PA TaxID=554121 RepID=UPI0039A6B4FC